MKRTPLKRHVRMKPGKPLKRVAIRRVSEAKAKRDRVYNARVRVWKEENPFCYPHLTIWGAGPAWTQDCHHIAGRAGSNLMDEETWMPVCRPCHDWIGDNKRAARVLGLLS